MMFAGIRSAAAGLALVLAPLAVMAGSLNAVAESPAEFGVRVGQTVPSIAGTTQSGAPATLDTLKGRKGLVLVFVRSADWCPFCKQQLEDLETISSGLAAAGYPMTAVSYDPVETLRTFADRKKLTYTLVSDTGSKTIDAFGIRNEEVRGNKRMDGIPHPVIFVIGADGVVKAKLYEESYRKRPPSSLVLETVKALP